MANFKKYSFEEEAKAEELILALAGLENELPFNQVTVTSETHGIVCDIRSPIKYEVDEETGESTEIVVERSSYNVDVAWKNEPHADWLMYEINVLTPKHNFI
jgi:hypothetical protein